MGVSKKCGTPKWMVYMENPLKMDDLGVPPFKETSIYRLYTRYILSSRGLYNPYPEESILIG